MCNGIVSLLLQLHADLGSHFPNDDRRLHVLCCRKKSCSRNIGSVRAFREVRKPAARAKPIANDSSPSVDKKPNEPLGTALFGGTGPASPTSNANPFSASKSSQPQQPNPFASVSSTSTLAAMPPQRPADEPLTASFADKLKISDRAQETTTPDQERWPSHDQAPAPFTSYHLDAGAEELEPDQPFQSGTSGPSKSQYDLDDSNVITSEKDLYESTLDKTFQKFSDRIAQNPEQVLRYEFKGQPLLYSGTDDVATRFVVPHGKAGATRGIPRCESCGAPRVFELQLVPGLIYELEKDEAMDFDDGMEWGTIIVGTCANNCGEAGTVSFREEWVGVQWEERVSKK